jgi:hypothetical protein
MLLYYYPPTPSAGAMPHESSLPRPSTNRLVLAKQRQY